MVDTTARSAHQVQDIVRSMFGNVQGMTEVQREIAQRLASVQQELTSETTEATREELELLSRTRDPREFATAQAKLVRRHGQRYVDSVKHSVDIVAELGNPMETVSHKASTRARARPVALPSQPPSFRR